MGSGAKSPAVERVSSSQTVVAEVGCIRHQTGPIIFPDGFLGLPTNVLYCVLSRHRKRTDNTIRAASQSEIGISTAEQRIGVFVVVAISWWQGWRRRWKSALWRVFRFLVGIIHISMMIF
ncbi:hypothetical protein EDD15DRAFT_368484 [Pisolithus albus]|nr:hypothetical protein EDD15DRAFT_368484 [Pisolithus albus]